MKKQTEYSSRINPVPPGDNPRMSRSKKKCPKCNCEMEDTGTSLWCDNCKDFYYNLTSNTENKTKRRELKKHMSKFTTDDLEDMLHEIIVERAEANQ